MEHTHIHIKISSSSSSDYQHRGQQKQCHACSSYQAEEEMLHRSSVTDIWFFLCLVFPSYPFTSHRQKYRLGRRLAGLAEEEEKPSDRREGAEERKQVCGRTSGKHRLASPHTLITTTYCNSVSLDTFPNSLSLLDRVMIHYYFIAANRAHYEIWDVKILYSINEA